MALDSAKKDKMEALLARPLLARLGTANPRTLQPHVVPVWFGWDGFSLYISAFASTRKVKDLRKNPRCSVVVDTSEDGAVLLEGVAELITDPAVVAPKSLEIYSRYLGPEGVKAADPQSWIVDPENTIIMLVPQKVFVW